MNHRIEHRICGEKKRRNPIAVMSNFLLSQDKDIAELETAEQVCAAFFSLLGSSNATHMFITTAKRFRAPSKERVCYYKESVSIDAHTGKYAVLIVMPIIVTHHLFYILLSTGCSLL